MKLIERWKRESQQMLTSTPETDTKKSADFEIYKTDEDQRLVFGWASVAITVDGQVLEDRQHDMIDPEDLEEAAYEYVLNFRDTGEEHLPGYRKKGKLVESCVFTPEKQKAMGIPEGTLPVAWWIGFKIDDEDTWQRVKNGTYRMFSIEGKAERQQIEKADCTAQTFDEVLKFNPYHGWHGYFSTANNATSMTVRTKDPAKQGWADRGIARAKERTALILEHEKLMNPENPADFDPFALLMFEAKHPEIVDARLGADPNGKPKSKPKTKEQASNDLFNADGSPKGQVTGKDISNDFEFDYYEHQSPVMQVAEKQGFLERPTVVPKEEFDKIAKETGVIAFRTVSDGYDKITGEETSAGQFADTIMHGDASKFSLNGDGGQAYGGGMYIATNSKPKPGETPDAFYARSDSVIYGNGDYPAVMTMTISPTAKIGDYQEVRDDFFNEPHSVKEKFDYDVGAYAAAKGYDGLRAKGAGWGSDYITMYNRTALIFSEEVQDRDGDPWVNLID